VAEELIFGVDRITTGAANDLAQATEIARNMVVRFGMSEKLGPLGYCETDDALFLGRSAAQLRSLSTGTARAIDQEIRAIVDGNYARARSILTIHLETLHRMAEALIEHETIDGAQIDAILRATELPSTGARPASLRPRAGRASGARAAAFHA
jgi:cell division protease FtsH